MHYSVLLEASVDALNIQQNGVYIDGTFGRGGHSRAILNRLSPEGKLIAFDCDPEAVSYAKAHIDAANFTIVHAPFSRIQDYCKVHKLTGKIDGILLDLGVSSPQLDQGERGFSFLRNGPLDMRMDPTSGLSAQEVLIDLSDQELADVFRTLGEERHAWRIAKTIKKHLNEGHRLETTEALSELVYQCIGKKEKKHPATRVFQALRIYVNQELEELEKLLNDTLNILAVKGRLSVISFHSLEDRIVKNFMRQQVIGDGAKLPRHLPLQKEQAPKMKWVIKKTRASADEISSNARSRSAVLRAVEKL